MGDFFHVSGTGTVEASNVCQSPELYNTGTQITGLNNTVYLCTVKGQKMAFSTCFDTYFLPACINLLIISIYFEYIRD